MSNWTDLLAEEKNRSYFLDTMAYVQEKRASGVVVYPPKEHVFEAFSATPFEKVKVVILGQDPYHGPNQAHGLCFSVLPGIEPPPSLKNIYKELASDIADFSIPSHGYLSSWAEQGVLLLNTVLTVEQGQAHSHKHLGWEQFTDKVIQQLDQNGDHLVFILWGAHAQKKGRSIDRDKHLVLAGPHPSPLSAYRGFFGCQHFSQTNEYLSRHQKLEIDWNSLSRETFNT